MDLVTPLWSALAGACLMLALMQLVVWCMNRHLWANLWFSLTVLGVFGLTICELITMRAQEIGVYEQAGRWIHLIYLFVTLGILGFVHANFGTGRRWLFGLALGLRMLAVVANFTTGANLHVIAVHSLRKMAFLGGHVTVLGEWQSNPWLRLGLLASLVLLAYVVDASWRLWRIATPDARRRAIVLGGTLAFFIILAPALPALVVVGVLRIPPNASLPFLGMLLAMSYELSREVLKAARMSADLTISQQRLSLAAAAAHLALWEWDVPSGKIWVSNEGRSLYGVSPMGDIDLGTFVATLHEEDRAEVCRAMDEALAGSKPYAAEYRIVLPDTSIRWISAMGRVDRDPHGRAFRMRGVSMDFTKRKQAEIQTDRQRQELAHLSRVSVLGEMAGALAHELNQPLAAMLSNSQVGRRSLNVEIPNLLEMAEIFDDITADAKRAGGIIHGMRAMLKKDAALETSSVHLNDAVNQVLLLLQSEIIGRKLEVTLQLAESLPPARVNHVEFQQVLINLVINGMDAMTAEPNRRCLNIATSLHNGTLVVSVRDSGPGIPAAILSRVFDPFFSTKSAGLGLGLSISRSIIERFGGQLLAENHADGGAVFWMVLPVEAS